jgi:ATP-dependent protease HslVU (ClpYQ) peptidase subunit
MSAAYDRCATAEEVVRIGLQAAAEFDSATGAPFEIHRCPLANAEPVKAAAKPRRRPR